MPYDFNVTISVGTYTDMTIAEVHNVFDKACGHIDDVHSWGVEVELEDENEKTNGKAEQKLYFLLGYIHAKAEEISKEFGTPIEKVKEELIEGIIKGGRI